MLVIDTVLVVVLLLVVVAGVQRGLVASIGALAGLVAGVFAALWLLPLVTEWMPFSVWRPAVVILAGLLLIVAGAIVGGVIGAALRTGVHKTALRGIDRVLGGVISLVVAALALSVVGTGIGSIGAPVVSAAVQSSSVLRAIGTITPDPVEATLAQLRAAVLDDGLPELGDLLDVGTAPAAPAVALDDPELAAAAASVARVSGVAFACGTSSTGTGFVAAPDRVVTNAHVVAGVTTPIVELPGLPAREGSIVYFDPVDDLAVIAVPDLGAPVLPVTATLAPGTAAAVQGYPFGGPFTPVNAEVLSIGTVNVPDIYGEASAPREIYALAATVQPGNSGGPLLDDDGAVAGVVFARAETDTARGYAMTPAELDPVLAQAPALTAPVTSGRCLT